jgi:Bacterial Ig-like domain (group 1)
MKLSRILLFVLMLTGLASCGGGGGNTLTGGGSSGTTATVASIAVTASATSVASDGSTSSTITATVVNSSNVAVAGVAVSFSASTGGALTVTQGTTDANGVATASLKASTATAGSTLTVTASAGSASGQVAINVVDAQHALALKVDVPQIPSDGARSATVTAYLKDANNNALPNVAVTFRSSSGVVVVTKGTTDANGLATATVSAGSDPQNRRITVTASAPAAPDASVGVDVIGSTLSISGPPTLVWGNDGNLAIALKDSSGHGIPGQTVTISSGNGNTLYPNTFTTDLNGLGSVVMHANIVGTDPVKATSLGLTATRSISVSSQSFNVVAPTSGTVVPLNNAQAVTAVWLNAGAPVVGQTVSFTTTRGTFDHASAVTDANGSATVQISSTNAGPAVITASSSGVAAQTVVDFIATIPAQISVQAAPSAVVTGGSSVVTATVRDAQNNLVESQIVDFVLTDSTGGTISVASATTDAQGQAQTTYTAGQSTSGANGVQVRATVRGTSVTGQTLLTVGGQTVYLSLGTGNTIDSPNAATYSITYAVFAVDSRGAPVAGAPIDLKVLPVSYTKGYRTWSVASSTYVTTVSTLPVTASCANEDVDFTGSYTVAKDYNGNGVLDPGSVAVVSPSSGVTGADGSLLVTVSYPKDHAFYVTVRLVATTAVTGTQSSSSSTFLLPYAASDFSQQSVEPPGPISPYGQASTCSDPT